MKNMSLKMNLNHPLIELIVIVFSLSVHSNAFSQDNLSYNTGKNFEVAQSARDEAKSDVVTQKIKDTQKSILDEAVIALNETQHALKALDENKPTESVLALEIASGKLDFLLARAPKLSLAPIYFSVYAHSINVTPQIIKTIMGQTMIAFSRGNIQQARHLICQLGSEMVIHVTNIPLASYSQAIKSIAPLIDKGQLSQAKFTLQVALSTLVVTSHVIPIPYLRSLELLKRLESLSEIQNRNAQQKNEITYLLTVTREQFEIARLLGYGDNIVYKILNKKLNDIESKIKKGVSAKDDLQREEQAILTLINQTA